MVTEKYSQRCVVVWPRKENIRWQSTLTNRGFGLRTLFYTGRVAKSQIPDFATQENRITWQRFWTSSLKAPKSSCLKLKSLRSVPHIWTVRNICCGQAPRLEHSQASFTPSRDDVMSQIFMSWDSFTWSELTLADGHELKLTFIVTCITQTPIGYRMST